jgi:hypothetical protein
MPNYEQPNRTRTEDAKTGRNTLTVSYIGDSQATAPTIANASLLTTSVVSAEAGMIRTTFQYDLTNSTAVTSPTGTGFTSTGIEYVGSLRTVPLEAHPRYAGLTAEEQKEVKDFVQNPISGSKALPTEWSSFAGVTSMSELATKMLSGQESYYEPTVILRRTYYASALPSGKKLGKITEPGIYYAAKPDNADWLLVSLSARGQSGNYTIVEEYELSGENGWDADLYT